MATLLAVAGVLAIMKLRADAATKALQEQYDAAKKAADAATDTRQKGDIERQEAEVKFVRLQQLQEMSEAAPLAAEQVQELDNLLAELDKYGANEWTSFDKLTGKLTIATDAQEQLNKKMAEAAKLQLEAELAATTAEKRAAQELKDNAEYGHRLNPFTSEAGRIRDIEAADARIMAAMKKEIAILARMRALKAGDAKAVTGGQATPAKDTAARVNEYSEQKKTNDKTYAKFADFLSDMDVKIADEQQRKSLDATLRKATADELDLMEAAGAQKLTAAREAYTKALEEATKATSDGGAALTDAEKASLLAQQKNITKRQEAIDAIANAKNDLDKKMEKSGKGMAAGALAGFVTADVLALLGHDAGGPEEETAKNTRAMAENIAVMIDLIRNRPRAAFA
ncbi:MAG: hypothetical protein GX945_00660 [Lentisphaerae bacterium]|nr:hypothetical protein [Lentisphaerota bacterium]